MKTLSRFLLLSCMWMYTHAAVFASKPVNARLQKVTVYLQGAHLYYSENQNVNTGYNELVFENISPYLSVSSLQASSKGAVVMDIKYQLKYREKPPVVKTYSREIEMVQDSMEDIRYELQDIANKKLVLESEKNMLLSNRIIKGQPLRDSLALLRDGMQFLKEKLNSIYEQDLRLQRQKGKADKKLTRLQARYNELQLLQNGQLTYETNEGQPTSQVVIQLFAETAGVAQIQFSYFVQQAGWKPAYDLQASSLNNQLQCKYFADVHQTTGINWNQVKVTISTSNPSEQQVKPHLSPWFVGYYAHREAKKALSNARLNVLSKTPSSVSKDDASSAGEDMEEKYLTEYIQVSENLIRTEYEIKLNYSVLPDGKIHKVLISQKDLPMNMQFEAVPKLCTDAFLVAKVTGWEELNIIPGNARLYFDGGFVGQTYLDPSGSNDTLSLNLGRDKSIVVTRKKVKEHTKTNFIGDEKTETRTIELFVKNTKSVAVDFQLEDQIPVVHGTQEIKVTLLDGDGAALDASNGNLKWKLRLNPKESKRIIFTYEIRYPKGKTVVGI